MKSTGIVRKVDNLGRIVLPSEMRQSLDIRDGSGAVEIFTDNGRIILQKYTPGCIFCGSVENLHFFNENRVCKDCIAKIKAEF